MNDLIDALPKEWTVEEQRQHRKELVEALRSGKYKKARGHLKQGDCFCVLGVGCDVSHLGEWVYGGQDPWSKFGESFWDFVPFTEPEDRRSGAMPIAVRDYYGFTRDTGEYAVPYMFDRYSGMHLFQSLVADNDAGELTFDQMADLIAWEPPGMFTDYEWPKDA